jgi:hypothetical protein
VDYALPENRIGKFLVYRLVALYEGDYYSAFIRSDLDTLLAQTGIEVTQKVSILLGAGRVLKGVKKR